MFDSELISECLNSPLGALSCSIVLQKQAKSCKLSGIFLHIRIPRLASRGTWAGVRYWKCTAYH